MKDCERTVILGGAAGQGLVTVAQLLLTILARRGYHLFAAQDYMSRVRGGHNFMTIRIADRRIYAADPTPELLVALDQTTTEIHGPTLTGPKVVLRDAEGKGLSKKSGGVDIPLPMQDIGKDEGNAVYANSAALGALLGLLGQPEGVWESALGDRFAKKQEILDHNLAAARAGFRFIAETYGDTGLALPAPRRPKNRLRLAGAKAIGLGLMAGGVNFVAAYPMSPSTGVFTYVIKNAEATGVITEQAEDEIAAINMAVGASAAGGRAAVTTSGGGMALMAEGISLAGIAETPVTIVDMMRPGPATGLPTRTGQEDLDFTLAIGHGEFPRFVFAPGAVDQAYHTAVACMNLGEKYQVPAFLLGDQYLVDTITTIDDLKRSASPFKNYRATDRQVNRDTYRRYTLTKSGVSPRAYYGQNKAVFMVDSHVHDEAGHITEDPILSMKMAEKRMAKLVGMGQEKFGLPERLGDPSGDLLVACFGSTYGPVREAVGAARGDGKKIGMLHFNRVWPFPATEVKRVIPHYKKVVVVENNVQGQFDRLLRRETGVATVKPILRYDGRPFAVADLTTAFKRRAGR